MGAYPKQRAVAFEPGAFSTFRFLERSIDACGQIRLVYGLDDAITFVEEFDLPDGTVVGPAERRRIDGLLALLHWVAGVSYFKTAVPGAVSCEAGDPPPAAALLLEALYSEGLGEFAFVNGLDGLPRPRFPVGVAVAGGPPLGAPRRVLVPIGGGKDSVVALETVRRAGCGVGLFSVGDADAIRRTAAVADLPRLVAGRRLHPGLGELNRAGALNGHVPITAIVSCVAVLVAALHGFDAVAMANERSASTGNLVWDGVEVNHQFSKSFRVEKLLAAAVAEVGGGVSIFSVLRPASELGIARAFARVDARYHAAFTSCNAVFRLDPTLRGEGWCCDCPKCRFVFLVLAPFMDPAALVGIFGRDLLDDDGQFDGFALLTATGGAKPFECVGEEDESLAAIRLLGVDPRWRDHVVVRRLVASVLPAFGDGVGMPGDSLALSSEHLVPAGLMAEVRAVLGA